MRSRYLFSKKRSAVYNKITAFVICVLFTLSNSAYAVKISSVANINTTIKTVRVGLANMTAESIIVTLSSNYTVNAGDFFYTPGTSLTLSVLNGKLSYDYGSCDELILTPQKSSDTIKLEIGAKKYYYRGTMRFKVNKDNKIAPINTLDIETYLKGVVGYEMSNSYPIEALKSQAIAARNYALISMNKHSKDGYDLCDTTDCQVYKGFNSTYLNVIRAVDETKNRVLVYGDELVSAYYGASCGGYTEASGNIWKQQLPYLIIKKDEFENEHWPYGDMKFTSIQMEKKIKEKKYLKDTDTFISMDLQSIKRNESARVSSLDIIYLDLNGVEIRKTITKDGARTFLSLPSSNYQVVYDVIADTYTFSGMGYGHGVGMSQIGARNRAKAGQTHRDILGFYYDGSKVVSLTEDILEEIDSTTNSSIETPGNSTTGAPVKVPDSTTGTPVKVPDSTTGTVVKNPSTSTTNSSTTNSSVNVPTSNTGTTGKNNENSIPKANPDKDGKTTTSSAINIIPGKTTNSGTNVKPAGILELAKIENYSFTRELKKGMKGNDVKKLQDVLKKLKFFSQTTTTYFGAVTEQSLKAFQKKQGIKTNGVADKVTLNKIGQALVPKKKATVAKTVTITSTKSTNITQ